MPSRYLCGEAVKVVGGRATTWVRRAERLMTECAVMQPYTGPVQAPSVSQSGPEIACSAPRKSTTHCSRSYSHESVAR